MSHRVQLDPRFFTDPAMVAVMKDSPLGGLVYQAIWCECDDQGVLPPGAEDIWSRYFLWADRAAVEGAVAALIARSRIVEFERYGRLWWWVPKYVEVQRPTKVTRLYPFPPPDLVAAHLEPGEGRNYYTLIRTRWRNPPLVGRPPRPREWLDESVPDRPRPDRTGPGRPRRAQPSPDSPGLAQDGPGKPDESGHHVTKEAMADITGLPGQDRAGLGDDGRARTGPGQDQNADFQVCPGQSGLALLRAPYIERYHDPISLTLIPGQDQSTGTDAAPRNEGESVCERDFSSLRDPMKESYAQAFPGFGLEVGGRNFLEVFRKIARSDEEIIEALQHAKGTARHPKFVETLLRSAQGFASFRAMLDSQGSGANGGAVAPNVAVANLNGTAPPLPNPSPPSDPRAAAAHAALLEAGVSDGQARKLCVSPGPAAITQQLAWFKHRKEFPSVGALIASIQQGWDAPEGVRQQAADERRAERHRKETDAARRAQQEADAIRAYIARQDEAGRRGMADRAQERLTQRGITLPPAGPGRTVLLRAAMCEEARQKLGLPPEAPAEAPPEEVPA